MGTGDGRWPSCATCARGFDQATSGLPIPGDMVTSKKRLSLPRSPGPRQDWLCRLKPETWLADRKARLANGLQRLARAARTGAIPGGLIENGTLKLDRLTAAVPEEAEAMVLDLYRRMPDIRITDLLLEVDNEVGFTEAFTHLRTGVPCKDRIGLLNVLLAEGLNLGLSKNGGCYEHP